MSRQDVGPEAVEAYLAHVRERNIVPATGVPAFPGGDGVWVRKHGWVPEGEQHHLQDEPVYDEAEPVPDDDVDEPTVMELS